MDLTLHVLVDPEKLPIDRVDAFCADVKRGGASVIQLRGKRTPIRDLMAFGQAVRVSTERHGLSFIVNDRADVALALSADGLHLGQDDLPVSDARKIAPRLTVGLSVGSVAELERARSVQPDYLGVGPVYRTLSKDDAGEPLGLERFAALWAEARKVAPVVAIGGLTASNVQPLWQLGVEGIAVISFVMEASNWFEACRQLLSSKS